MSTSDMPVPHTATMDEAMAALSDDPVAYNLPPGTPDDQVQARKKDAATALVAGSAANAAYWNSRSELEQFVARAQGHGRIEAPPTAEGDTPTGVAAPTGDAGAPVESTATPVEVPQTTEAAQGQPAPGDGESVEDKLRAQLRAANLEPEA